MVSHELNGLDPATDYLLTVMVIKDEKTINSYPINVYAFGVLPMQEKDAKALNRHEYGWCDSEKRWVKIPIVKLANGTYAVATTVVSQS